jgi:hypothetical protein
MPAAVYRMPVRVCGERRAFAPGDHAYRRRAVIKGTFTLSAAQAGPRRGQHTAARPEYLCTTACVANARTCRDEGDRQARGLRNASSPATEGRVGSTARTADRVAVNARRSSTVSGVRRRVHGLNPAGARLLPLGPDPGGSPRCSEAEDAHHQPGLIMAQDQAAGAWRWRVAYRVSRGTPTRHAG